MRTTVAWLGFFICTHVAYEWRFILVADTNASLKLVLLASVGGGEGEYHNYSAYAVIR